MTVTVPQGARRSGRDEPQDGTRSLRAAFIMEQDVGHVVQAVHLRRELAQIPDLDWSYIPVSFWSEEGLIERLKFLPATVRASYRARLEVLAGLQG
ncbi:MAG TPA: hypothetical protein VG845_03325, partial [Dehalococcoidia bacterium]|nr:hypothetical protein [Dehalococcoidia bacterium]